MERQSVGFSLIELVVVILIISILAAMAVPRLFHSIYKAHDAAVTRFQAELISSLNVLAADWTLWGGAVGSDTLVPGRAGDTVRMTMEAFPNVIFNAKTGEQYDVASDSGCIGIAQYILGMPREYFVVATAGHELDKSKLAHEKDALWRVRARTYDQAGVQVPACVFYYIRGFDNSRLWGGIVYQPFERIPVRMFPYVTETTTGESTATTSTLFPDPLLATALAQ